jgi:DNA-binding NarL/FixJ family response regulator
MNNFEIVSLKENAKDIKILYVENHAGTRLKFSRFLKEYCDNVTVVAYPDYAIELFLSGYFDLIITDANLPDMDVATMCKKIKHVAPRKPIVIISHATDSNLLVELINIGIEGFIRTPYDRDEVVKILSKVILNYSDTQILYSVLDQLQENCTYKEKKLTNTRNLTLLNNNNLNLLLHHYDHISAKDFIDIYPKDLFIIGDKLLSIIEDIDLYINQFVNQKNKESVLPIIQELEEFSNVVEGIQEFSNISIAVQKISMLFATLDYSKSYEKYYDVILLISGELMNWCENIFINQSAEDIHYLDKSLLADALMLENLFKGLDNTQSDDDSLEFF